jgi:NTE family protein
MKRFSTVFAAAVLCIVCFSSMVAAQELQKRPLVGIALSGGGASGLAEIGVLHYLEEHRIPVDVMAGTSIGGLLGGLYATGHDAAYLEKLVKDADWQELLRATTKFENLSISEKQDWNRVKGVYLIPFRSGLSLPGGINAGQSLVRLLSRETAAYWDVQDFNNLPIPFRCVATDLISGKEFVFKEGHLVEALRATMAIPGIFTPLERDGRVLVDGGVVNNLPVSVVREMGADVVLAVTLQVASPSLGELQTLPDVVRQSASLAVLQNERLQGRLADIEIAIPVQNRGSMDFHEVSSLIDAGYRVAAENQSVLERLSLSEDKWEIYVRNRNSRERTMPDRGPLISVSAGDPMTARNAASELERKTGPTTSEKHLESLLEGFTAATGLPNAYYGWHSDPGIPGYQVKLESRPATEIAFSPSFFYQLSKGEPGRPTFRLASTVIRKDAYKSRFLGAVELGSDIGLFFEYYRPHNGSASFIAPGFAAEREHFYTYEGDTHSDQTRLRIAASLYVGIGTWRHLQFRIGALAGVDRYSNPVVTNNIESTNTSFVNPEVVGIINTEDSGLFPSRGFRLNGSAGWSFRDHPFPYIQMNFDHFQPLGKQFTLIAMGQTDSSLGTKVGFYDQFTAGGLTDLDAYRYQEIRGDTVLTGGGGILYRGANLTQKMFRPIFGSWYQAAGIDPGSNSSSSLQSAAVGMFSPTPLGIAGAVLSFDLRGSVRFRLSLGSFWNRP